MREQPFLDFLSDVMYHSPTGKWFCSRNRNVRKLKPEDILNFFDPNENGNYYHGEMEFLLEHCRSKL